jgi:hypothetical protein
MIVMEQTARLAIFAIATAIGIIGVEEVVESFEIPLQLQEAEARGCHTSIAFNASKGRCFGH